MSDAERRIGNDEREAAVEALQAHLTAGRLTSAEYEERSLQAREARTGSDLTALFADLPKPWPTPASGPALGSTVDRSSGGLLPEAWGAWLASLSPFAALLLFFTTGHWQWFLLIPVLGMIAYGPNEWHGGHGRDHRRRHRGGV
jgi:hypothetical protein